MLKDDINLALGQAQKHDEANGNDTQHIMLIYITNFNRKVLIEFLQPIE